MCEAKATANFSRVQSARGCGAITEQVDACLRNDAPDQAVTGRLCHGIPPGASSCAGHRCRWLRHPVYDTCNHVYTKCTWPHLRLLGRKLATLITL